jgi:hypothetical protein
VCAREVIVGDDKLGHEREKNYFNRATQTIHILKLVD